MSESDNTPPTGAEDAQAAPKKKTTRKKVAAKKTAAKKTAAKKTTTKKTAAKKTTAKKTTRKKAATKKVASEAPAEPTPAPKATSTDESPKRDIKPAAEKPAPEKTAPPKESTPPAQPAANTPAPQSAPTEEPSKPKVTRESISRRPRRDNRERTDDQDERGERNERNDRRGGRRNDRDRDREPSDSNDEQGERSDRNDRRGGRRNDRRGGRNNRDRNRRGGRNNRRGRRNDNDQPDVDTDHDFDEIDDDPNVKPGFRDRKRNREQLKLDTARPCEGFLEISTKGFGFLRTRQSGFQPSPSDVFVLPDTVRHFGLRQGMMIIGEACDGPRGPQMTDVKSVNGRSPEAFKALSYFEELTAINPDRRFVLETTPDRYTTRVIDMMTPIGRGQRGLIVAPPRAGKTTLLQHIAEAISENYEDVHLMTLLIDERPEEVTALTRSLPNAEVFASSNDNDARSHMRVAEFAIERAKRLVEEGRDVFILLDSITRLGRAFNNAKRGKGRSMSGGVDIRALEIPRKLFAAARNTREAGSLTIIATALIETGSRADDLIFQEFKGTGNMELVLDRKIAQKYVYPAVDIFRSGTRREELLLPPHQLAKISLIRRGLSGHKPIEAIERLLTFLERFPNNAQMLMEIKAQGY
ncbi:transcription termination factor Rho [Sulfuriroseicoccus oceanibius]|uniref:Transcription termination factor Rho n=1 Tax=Sulfuriroseicoccus oceanibius TaxID=2707525 RepID=A0A6B3L9C9_9BACT|nr:transcription termination factor Rho [Sulfuriroseicoccus oceanibius]QQL45044.1 transcription termination factor Rho [Sulfuriroseicoccus oceanibius]